MFEKIKERIDFMANSNVWTFDVWVMATLTLLFGFSFPIEQHTQSEILTFTQIVVGILMYSIIVVVFLFCTRLREYRYLDWYSDCTKKVGNVKISNMVLWGIIPGIVFTAIAIYVQGAIYPFLIATTTLVLSMHFNNTKDLKGDTK